MTKAGMKRHIRGTLKFVTFKNLLPFEVCAFFNFAGSLNFT